MPFALFPNAPDLMRGHHAANRAEKPFGGDTAQIIGAL